MPADTPPLGERRYEPRPATAAGFEFIMGQIVAVALVTLLIGAALYCLPAIVARRRAHPKTTAIFALNLLLGWTFIGWVAALVWSLTAPPVGGPATPQARPPDRAPWPWRA